MEWRIEWTEKAHKDLENITSADSDRILASIDCVLDDPVGKLDRLANSCLYKCRVGKYRVVVSVEFDRRVVVVARVRKRSRAYR